MKLTLNNILVEATHGVKNWEQTHPQTFRIDIELTLTKDKIRQDSLAATLDWTKLKEEVEHITTTNQFALVETLTHEIATTILAHDEVTTVTVHVSKEDLWPHATPTATVTKP